MKSDAAQVPFRRALFWLAVILQVLTLCAVIGWRVSLVRTGTPVLLRCAPVDPRSLFSGDYIALDYQISRMPNVMFDDFYSKGEVVYVALVRGSNSPYWEPARVSSRRSQLAKQYEVVMRGRVGEVGVSSRSVRFGIESYFVPQREGRKLERQLIKTEVHAEVAVARSGQAALKKLFIDGKEVGCY